MYFYSPKTMPAPEKLRKLGFDEEEVGNYYKYLYKMESKSRLASMGKTAHRDSMKQAVYNAEHAWERKYVGADSDRLGSFKEAEKFLKKVTKSKTWVKLVEEFGGEHLKIKVSTKKTIGAYGTSGSSAYAYEDFVWLHPSYGLYKSTVLHELAHAAGNWDHDVHFRQCFVKLVSRFMGRDLGKDLHKEFRSRKLKMTLNVKAKSPKAWLALSRRMKAARAARG